MLSLRIQKMLLIIQMYSYIHIHVSIRILIQLSPEKHRMILGQDYLLLISCSVMSNSLRPYGLQHARLPCPSQDLLVAVILN